MNKVNTYNFNGENANIYDLFFIMCKSHFHNFSCNNCPNERMCKKVLKNPNNEIVKTVADEVRRNMLSSDLNPTEDILEYELDGEKYNIFDLFFNLCEYQEKEIDDSCSTCYLNQFCFKNKEQIERFWEEVYSKGHFTLVENKG